MLQGIRNATEHWFGKLVMSAIFVLLIAGLGVFGVEDLFRGGSGSTVATVGDTPITGQRVREVYQQQVQRLQQEYKRAFTPEQLRALGIERQILSHLVSEAALDEKTRALGLAISDEEVRRMIREEQAFKDAGGRFDTQKFYQVLARAGLSEPAFVQEQRAVGARQQLAAAVGGEIAVPQAMRAALHRYQTERRTIGLIQLSPEAAGSIPEPSQDELKSYYEDNKASYRAPETRGLSLLVLEPEKAADENLDAVEAGIPDEEVRRLYEANTDKYSTPERRTIQQITFPDEASAELARKQIETGEVPFEVTAVARGVDPKNLALGNLSKAELFDKAVADAAFALEKNAVSQPVKGRFGTVLLRVTAIEPATQKSFDQAKDEIRKAIAQTRIKEAKDATQKRARDRLEETQAAIEDARADGKPLADIAKDRGLKLVEIPAVDAAGKDPAGNPVAGIPDQDTVLPAAFRTEAGADNPSLRTKEGGYVWYDVTKVVPEREKSLDEVRDAVATGWKQAQIAKRLADKAKELTAKLDAGTSPEAVAQEAGLQATTVSDIGRRQPKAGLSEDVIERIFATPVGKAGSAPSGEGRAVFKVMQATMPAFVAGASTDEGAQKGLQPEFQGDVLAEYTAEVLRETGFRPDQINQTVLRRAIGGDS